MFLRSEYQEINNLKGFEGVVSEMAADSSTFPVQYEFWKEHLFERMMRLFVWNCTPIDQKEIEQRLLLQGYCGILPYPKDQDPGSVIFNRGELTAFFGALSGVTKYIDEKKNFIAHSPMWTGTYEIGKECALINNTAIRNPAMHLIHHYAVLLAHADVSLTMCIINHRTDSGIPVAKSQKHKDSIHLLQKKVFNGQYGSLADIGDLGLEYIKVTNSSSEDITKLFEVREKLIKSFYADIGVRSAFEKNNNTVVDEITSDQSFLLLNISDMLEQRKLGCERVNKLYGTSWSVDIAPEIKLIMEEKEGETDENTEDSEDIIQDGE